MESTGIRLIGGTLQRSSFKELVSKSQAAVLALIFVFPILISTGIYKDLREACVVFGVLINALILFRLYWMRQAPKYYQKDASQYWSVFRYTAIATGLVWGFFNAYIIWSTPNVQYAYFAMLAVFGIAAGGITNFFPDLKLSISYLASILIPAVLVCFFGKHDLLFLGIGGSIFFIFFVHTVRIQHDFFWSFSSSRSFLNTLFDALPCPVSVISQDLRYVKVNRALANINNNKPEDYIGKPMGFHSGYQNSKELLEFVSRCFDETAESYEREIEVPHENGSKHYYFVGRRFGQEEQIICISLDLTDLKNTQLKLEKQQAMSIEAARLSSIGEVANSMAHEINNPLAIILGKTHQAERLLNLNPDSSKDLINCFDVISSNVTRISNIIKALRQIVSGQNDEFETHSLKSVIDSSLILVREKIISSDIHLEIQSIPSIVLTCNHSQVSQAILNTLNNAYDAVLNQKEPWIELGFHETKEEIEILITDSGAGVSPENLDKIFQPFFTTKEIGKGVGLGLSVSKGIIDSHGGRFFIDKTCKNTRFVIALPKYTKIA